MSVTLMPRLSQIAVDEVLDQSDDGSPPSPSLDFVQQLPEAMSYAASGGSPIRPDDIKQVRDLLVAAAEKNGFPVRGTTKERSQFDTDVTILLGEHPLFVPPETFRDDVWAFLTTVVAPDIVGWRFGSTARERYQGGVRNALQRLWMRAWSLDRGSQSDDRWGLVRDLTEDAFVQIVERPSIGGDRRISRALAEGWVRMSERTGRGAMEAIMRRAVIAFRLRNQVQVLAALYDDELELAVDSAFERARISLDLETGSSSEKDVASKASHASGTKPRSAAASPNKTETRPERAGFSRIRAMLNRGRNLGNEAD